MLAGRGDLHFYVPLGRDLIRVQKDAPTSEDNLTWGEETETVRSLAPQCLCPDPTLGPDALAVPTGL